VQFVIVYHLLQHGHPITYYESMRELFDFL
jgi:hypothetical protein